jgi:hypothetical protein
MKNTTSQFLSPSTRVQDFYRHLGEEINLCSNGAMAFHWADFKETCEEIQSRLETDEELKQDFERKRRNLERLMLIPVWIRTQSKVHQTTLYSLYEAHILNRTQQMDGLDFFGPLEISLISGTGPFKSMAIAECFNKDVYQDFVLLNLIRGKLPKRDFRVRLKSRVLMEYGNHFEKAQLISLEQLTTNGLLFSLDIEVYLREVSKSENMRFLIETTVLGEAIGKNMDELKAHLSQSEFNLMYSSRKTDALEVSMADIHTSSSFEFLKNHKKFLFVPYKALKGEDAQSVKRITSFVEFSRDLVRDLYRPDRNVA